MFLSNLLLLLKNKFEFIEKNGVLKKAYNVKWISYITARNCRNNKIKESKGLSEFMEDYKNG